MCKKNNFQKFLLFAIEMAVLSVFLQKKGLGPLGVKVRYAHLQSILITMEHRVTIPISNHLSNFATDHE